VLSEAEQAAKQLCLRWLTSRSRTRAELHAALLRKGVEEAVAGRVLDRLAAAGLVDDEAYAADHVRSARVNRGLARRALRAELARRGVAETVARAAVDELDPASEEQRARELVRARLPVTVRSGSDDAVRLARRLLGMLARKGYPPDLAHQVVRTEVQAVTGSDPLDAADHPDAGDPGWEQPDPG
jgi:regulatory protein